MRQLMLGLCLFAAACSDPGGPTAPSALGEAAGAQAQATTGVSSAASSAAINVTFAKWIDGAFPNFTGVAGGDVPGAFAATVLERTPSDNGNLIHLRARYEVIATNPAHAFTAEIEGNQNNQTQSAVLNGRVVEGWLTGARAHVTFDVVRPCPQHDQPVCFVGVLKVLPGSAH
jgi:hypothetical protein